ncbi:T9SS type A sorting domain-containing protein [Chitinophaga sp. S165]|uniref:T9SS type A sorting domain-containing protein n=1 Tax=Chitinophaga sp. S165 TaxID=2135462 RepID=UPI000D70EAE6|nr:T9SS type A sorting domain-containing protein [Chitinophaga sp. S165]PWV45557.1 putative secreted protein (Por secretion system target) [Chitinophaga sp. S165]
MKRCLLILCFLVLSINIIAQNAAYIPPDGKVWSFGNVAFFGDVTNDGMLGSSPASVLYFLGRQWTNSYTALLSDESPSGLKGTGGTFRFINNSSQQIIAGGYNVATKTGASFPNLEVNNPNGIVLADLHDLHIRNTLQLTNGHVFLNGWNLMVGADNPGSITGYSDQRFIVTGTETAGGFLYRAKLDRNAGQVVFPVGTSATNYAPAGVRYEGAPEDFKARVFDSVYLNAISGRILYDSVVFKTWNLGQEGHGTGLTSVTLQHMNADEAPEYTVNRESSYISRFFPGDGWELRKAVNDGMAPGTLTTQPMQQEATMHSRGTAGIGTNIYYAKLTSLSYSYLPADIIHFNAYRISYSLVDLVWTTNRETNNAVFEIERMLDNETAFKKIATVATKAPRGYSTTRLDYYYQDTNDYDGWSYYRIKAVSTTGKYVYTDVREVGPLVQATVFPNPNYGDFKVTVRGIKAPLIVQVFDTWGQQVRRMEMIGQSEVRIKDMPTGTYFLVLTHKETKKQAYVCKVIVIDH